MPVFNVEECMQTYLYLFSINSNFLRRQNTHCRITHYFSIDTDTPIENPLLSNPP